MSPVYAIALSGMNAATLRLRAAASNIANVRSAGAIDGGEPGVYVPVDVVEAAQAYGGVMAMLLPSRREALQAYDPQASFANARGMVATPDIDLVEETVQMAMASYNFTANLTVLQTASEMERRLVEIRA